MKKYRILVDMDEVLNNLLDAWVGCLNEVHNARAVPEDIHTWSLTSAYPSLSEDEVNQPLLEDAFYYSFKPKPYSVEYMKKMMDDGHEVYVVTAQSIYQTIPAKMDWLFEHYPFISWRNVIITSRKQMVKGDILIDDGVHNLIGGDYVKILYDSPSNRQYDAEKNGMIRVYNLKEAYGVIQRLG